MIDLEPILLEAQQAKRTWCFAHVDPQALIELCAEVKALRAENALLRIGLISGQSTKPTFSVTTEGPPGNLHYESRKVPTKP